jgi:hemolysin activation/secretion protein
MPLLRNCMVHVKPTTLPRPLTQAALQLVALLFRLPLLCCCASLTQISTQAVDDTASSSVSIATPRLIVAPPNPAGPREAVRRKIKELNAGESKAQKLAALQKAASHSDSAKQGPVFEVKGFQVLGSPVLPTNTLAPLFFKLTGTHVTVDEMVKAAFVLQAEYGRQGCPRVSVALAPKEISNGLVTLNVFQAPTPQIVVAGQRYEPPVALHPNPPPKFPVRAYEVTGDTLLSDANLSEILGKYTGTNIGVAEILKAGSELQGEYRERGYPTVNVTIPPQQITNAIVRIRIFEGQLADLIVTNNHHFSSRNILRALPSLHTNDVLVGPVLQSELDRANANQDRQIYPQITPGPVENSSALVLDVKDRLPLHGKVEFNNQSSPGTPDLRINTSAAYHNLWQLEHSVGVQYSFSPLDFKSGNRWDFYDVPLVANYSGFYRLPLGNPESVADVVTTSPGGFGYDEATRKFRLPPPSGRPELNLYGSRSAIDTGLQTVFTQTYGDPGTNQLTRQDVQQDLTLNYNLGARLSMPLRPIGDWQSVFSAGGDYKNFQSSSYKTNIFTVTQVHVDESGRSITNISITPTPVPSPTGVTVKTLDYLPLSLRYDASERDAFGTTSLGLGLGFNAWRSGSVADLQKITGSRKSGGHWFTLTPSVTRDFIIHTNWLLSLHADAQLASEPLISNEQFGLGGVNSVRGYHEGEVFGDNGWRVSVEQKSPAQVIGLVSGKQALIVRGSIFMDYAETYLLDPRGRDARLPLWGVGVGAVASVGTYWEARLLFSVPLLNTSSTQAGQPRFNFALTAQF